MILLLTNDDGIDAPGLLSLSEALEGYHEVWTVAPEREMSGRSHAITLSEGLKLQRLEDRRFAVRGTPVDCVTLGLEVLLPQPPDLVISGINKGPNLGTDILYSGTCAAAREAGLRNFPAIAVSHSSAHGPWDFSRTAGFLSANLDLLVEHCVGDRFLNINWPANVEPGQEPVFTRPGKRRYKDERVSFSSPRGGEYWFLKPASIESSSEEGTDTAVDASGRVSISPIALEPVHAPIPIVRDTIPWRGC